MSKCSSTCSSQERRDTVIDLSCPASCRKRPRSSNDFYELLLCPICYDYFVPPVVQCIKGHSFCLRCVQRMQERSQQSRCPSCRSDISTEIRNHLIEDQLEHISIGCVWRYKGCEARVTLKDRDYHEKTCTHRPGATACYFVHQSHDSSCNWSGNPRKLPQHLRESHDLQTIDRSRLVKFLWNPPKVHCQRFRYRVLKVDVASDGRPKTKFILEHVYEPSAQLLLFLVRTLDSEFKTPYRIMILNRHNETNRLCFEGQTASFDDVGQLADWPKLDKKAVMCVPLSVLEDFSFYSNEDDQHYFSLHVEFLLS